MAENDKKGGNKEGAKGAAVRITSKKDGFRCAGVAHSDKPVEHKAGAFTPAQIEQLQACSMLIVEVLG